MKRYRKKPVIVEAWVVGSPDRPHWIDVALANEDMFRFENHGGESFSMKNEHVEDGMIYAYPGELIIRGIKGELYVCAQDIFEASYEEVGE